MPFEKGNELSKGRPKGSKNKNQVRDIVKEKYPDYDPVLAMVELAADTATVVTEDGVHELVVDANLRQSCHKEIARYWYPQLKAVEHKGSGGVQAPDIIFINHANIAQFIKPNGNNGHIRPESGNGQEPDSE